MENETRKNSSARKVFRFLLFACLGGAMLLILALVMVFVYSDEVKAAILKEINKNLKTEVQVLPQNISITMIRTFPDCSLEFSDVLMLGTGGRSKKDTLLYAGRINLHFNFLDLLRKRYRIKELSVRGGGISLKTFSNGQHNFIFWDEKEPEGGSQTEFDLERISLADMNFSYMDLRNHFHVNTSVKKINFTGRFKSSEYDLIADADILIKSLTTGNTNLLRDKRLQCDLELEVKNSGYKIKPSSVRLNDLELDLAGSFSYEHALSNLNLKFDAPDLNISSFMSLLPASERGRIKDYRSSGSLYAGGTVIYRSPETYTVESSFGFRNAAITYVPNDFTAEKVNLQGKLFYSESRSVLLIPHIDVILNNDTISGECQVSNFKEPMLQLKADASVQLENLQNFWPVDTVSRVKGRLRLHSEISGVLHEIKTQILSEQVTLVLEAAVEGLEVEFRNDERLYTVEKCLLAAQERRIKVKDLILKRGTSDLTINGEIPGMLNYLLDNTQPLVIKGSLYSKALVLEDFLQKENTGPGFSGPLIPAGVHLTLDAAIDKFTFGKFEAGQIKGDIEIKNQKAIISEVRMQTMNGDATINAFADNANKKLEVVLEGDLRNIDIHLLFKQMNNFGQSTLTDQNIRGSLSSKLDFKGEWNDQLIADEKTIAANCQLEISRGRLVAFSPLDQLSRFVDVEDLKDIRFATLQSNITISNRTINIPKTSVKNSALNIEFSGTHTFDNQIDYHIRLLISELLAKKRKKQTSEFGEVASDPENRRSAFVRMTGSVEDPRIRYDKQGMKEKVAEDIREEKSNIRRILHEELGLFRKDSAVRKPREAEPVFKLESEKPKPKKGLELKKKEEEDF